MSTNSQIAHFSLFTEFDIALFRSGKHFRLYEKLGSHIVKVDGITGVYFAVWAPNAEQVQVVGDFNDWNGDDHWMKPRLDSSGIWELFIPELGNGTLYKYKIRTREGHDLEKGDPFATFWEVPPKTASIVWELNYEWQDSNWKKKQQGKKAHEQPYSVYEVHLGSWMKKNNESLSYREMADEMVSYVKEMGFTHIEMMPVMEHPYFPSWGYQITGYFAPTSRFGTPQDFMYLMDKFHEAEIGVILDWVPSHFPTDAHGLSVFDGTHLYEHEDPRQGFHPDWKSSIFNYGRMEVRSFLISNALFWLDRYHADGLRVDAVASMLYLDYSREEGEWIPNIYGGNENLEAISFLKEFNETVYKEYPDAVTIAEESTAWGGVSRPVYAGGLGFGQKWMMGWMHDTLDYFKRNPVYRRYHQDDLTFSMVYAFTENFMLPLSHDEVVHGKGALINRMPGDEWQRFANLRLMFGYMYTHPGSQLIFMGGEFGQTTEWSIETGLEWWLTEHKFHKGMQQLIKDLNHFYTAHPALFHFAFKPEGFQWIDYQDRDGSVLAYARKGTAKDKPLLVVCNFTPTSHEDYKVGVPQGGQWQQIFNSDEEVYGGSGMGNEGKLKTYKEEWHGCDHSIRFRLAPLAMIILEPVRLQKPEKAKVEATEKKQVEAPKKATKTKAKK